MADSTHTDEQPQPPETSPRRKRRGLKIGAVLLLLGGAGSAAAFHFLTEPPEPPPPAEYDQPDIGQATEEVQDANTDVAKGKQALHVAEKSLEEIQAEWESAKEAKEKAEAKLKTASADELAQARKTLEAAEHQLALLTNERNAAKAQVTAAGNRLDTDEQKKKEAQEKQRTIRAQLAKQETQRQGLLGKWKRSADYGEMELELKDAGQASMTIHFNTAAYFVVGTRKLEIDIEWKIASDDHLIFDSLRGRPEKAFHFVTVTLGRGTHRDQILEKLTGDSFTTHDVGEEDDVKTWTRIKQKTEEK